MRDHRSLAATTALLLGCAALAGPAAAGTRDVATTPPPGEEAPRVVLLFDASGSMNGPDPSGVTKLEAAKQALTTALGSLPPTAEVGLRVYGATVPGDVPTPEACADTQLVHPISPLDTDSLTAAIASFEAVGETPIAYSILQAAEDLGDSGKRHIILVSDGEERCTPDPCGEVAALAGSGIDLQIDTVGFAVNQTAREQLQCIAHVGNGSYYEAANADSLSSALVTLSTRTARPFAVQGLPVTGTPEPGVAPTLTAGQYTDEFVSSAAEEVVRHYRIERTIPGSTLRASTLARLPRAEFQSGGLRRGTWSFTLRTEGGTECDTSTDFGSDLREFGVLVNATLLSLPLDPLDDRPTPVRTECAEADALTLEVRRGAGEDATTPLELRVIEEPPVVNLDELPAGVEEVPMGNEAELAAQFPAPAGEPTPVIGGSSFNDALPITPGFYETELVFGEMAFFTAPLDWGQGGVFAIRGPDVDHAPLALLEENDYLAIAGNVYAPDFSQMDSQEFWNSSTYYVSHAGLSAEPSNQDINQIPEIRYRNRWDSPAMFNQRSQGFSLAGDYYFAVTLSARTDQLVGVPIPVRFSLDVTGEPAGAPEFADPDAATPEPTESVSEPGPEEAATEAPPPSPSAEVTAGAEEGTPSGEEAPVGEEPTPAGGEVDDGGAPVGLIAGGLALVAVVAAGAFLLGRRGRS
ncbi:MAG: VWA domain-containing protein [bacterium]|nr:VWA domain-containing protein [bacterium]